MTNTATQEKHHTADDIIAVMLSFVEVDCVIADPQTIHETIADMKQHYPLLEPFIFGPGPVYSDSLLLERVFSRFQITRIIQQEIPDYKRYILNKLALCNIREKLSPKFAPEEIEQLKQMAQEFQQRCRA